MADNNINPEDLYYNKVGSELTRDFLLQNNDFIGDARQFLFERKGFSLRELQDDQEVYDRFIRHMRHTEINELASINDLRHVNKLDDTGKAQMGKLYSVWDRMEGEKSSVLDAFKDYGLGIVTAPSTYTSIVTGGAGKLIGATGAVATRLAARQAATRALTKQIRQQQLNISRALPTNLVARRAITGGLGAGTVEAAVGASLGYTGERVRQRTDLTGETEFRKSQPAIHGGIGFGVGAVLGGGYGAFRGGRAMRALRIGTKAAMATATRTLNAEKAAAQTVSTEADKDQFYNLVNAVSTIRGRPSGLQPIARKIVEEGEAAKAEIFQQAIDEIPFPKTTWARTTEGVYKTEIGFYKTNEGKIRPIGKETPADVTKIPIFSEIVRSGTRGKYQYTVSTGTEAMDLLPASQTFKTLKEAKDAVPGIVRERKLLPTITDDFSLTSKVATVNERTPEEAADSLHVRLSALLLDWLNTAKARNLVDKSATLDLSIGEEVTEKAIADFSKLRFSEIMHKVLQQADDDQRSKFVGDLLEKYNVTFEQLTSIYTADASQAASILGSVSSLSKAAQRAAFDRFREPLIGEAGIANVEASVKRIDPDTGKEITEQMQAVFSPEVESFMRAMEKGQNSIRMHLNSNHAWQAIGEFDRFRKGAMTMMPATTIRNAENATIRAGMYMFTNLLQGAFEYSTAAARRTGGEVGRIKDPKTGLSPVELRAVDMRKAVSRMAMPVKFARNLFDPEDSQELFEFFSKAYEKSFQQYTRQYDVEDLAVGQRGGKLTQFARKLNALNAYIDNAFKRAIYVTELGQRVGHKRLIQLSEEGRFNEIPFEHHLGAMDAGLDFTYQTRFTGPGKTERLVTFNEVDGKTVTRVLDKTVSANTIADVFVKAFSFPVIGSANITYPRFIASFLKHTFEYTPFLGMIPLERLGLRYGGVPQLGPKLSAKKHAKHVVEIVNANPKGDIARLVLSEYEGGIVGKAWADEVNLASKPYTNPERKIMASYDGAGGDKAKQFGFILPGRTLHKMVAQQVVGTGLLYGAIQLLAAQGPEAEWYELHNVPLLGKPFGDIHADARAFYGAYLPYMFLAHILLKSTNFLTGDDPETIRSWVVPNEINRKAMENSARDSFAAVALARGRTSELLEIAFGTSFKTGQGLAILDGIAKEYQENPDMLDRSVRNRFAEKTADYLYRYVAGATVPFGLVKDVLGTLDPVWQEIPAGKEVNPFLLGAYGDARRQPLMTAKQVRILTRALPQKNIIDPKTGEERRALFGSPYMKLPRGFERPAVSSETTRLLRSEGQSVQKQIFGIGAGRYKNELQREFARLNMRKPWAEFRRYRNDILDRVAQKYSADRVEEHIINLINTDPKYQEATPLEQKRILEQALEDVRESLDDRMEELIGATSDLAPTDSDIQELLESEDGERKHRQLINTFYEIGFKRRGNLTARSIVRRNIKEGKYREFLEAGFPKGTILSEVTAMAKNEDGSPKYTLDQISLVYRLARDMLKEVDRETDVRFRDD